MEDALADDTVDYEDEDDEDDDTDAPPARQKSTKKKGGRKAIWTERLLDDMVDIITNNEKFTEKLIFTNYQAQKNKDIYHNIIIELKSRVSDREPCDITIVQARNKFKKLLGICKQAALTIQTKTGLSRLQIEKEYGDWFEQLFQLVQTRDSCQPEQAVEPSSSLETSGSTETKDIEPEQSTSQNTPTTRRLQYTPMIGSGSRKRTLNHNIDDVLDTIKQIVTDDSIQKLIDYQTSADQRNREHDLEIMKILFNNTQAQDQSPGIPQRLPSVQCQPNSNASLSSAPPRTEQHNWTSQMFSNNQQHFPVPQPAQLHQTSYANGAAYYQFQ